MHLCILIVNVVRIICIHSVYLSSQIKKKKKLIYLSKSVTSQINLIMKIRFWNRPIAKKPTYNWKENIRENYVCIYSQRFSFLVKNSNRFPSLGFSVSWATVPITSETRKTDIFFLKKNYFKEVFNFLSHLLVEVNWKKREK